MSIVRKHALVNINELRPHEEIDEKHLEELLEEIVRDGILKKPVVADRETLVVIDGHHRVEALKRIGASKIPVVLVDYGDPKIVVKSWNGSPPPSKDEVVERALKGRLFPPKTTRHVVVEEGGEKHVSELVGEENVPLTSLGARSSRAARRAL